MICDILNNADKIKEVAQQTASKGKELSDVTFDPSLVGTQGLVISAVGYVIVFFALVGLFLFIKQLTKVLTSNLRKRLRESGDIESSEKEDLSVSGEVNAAISTAIFLHFREVHDIESTTLTIEKVQKRYSPWSSKLYNLRQYPTKR